MEVRHYLSATYLTASLIAFFLVPSESILFIRLILAVNLFVAILIGNKNFKTIKNN